MDALSIEREDSIEPGDHRIEIAENDAGDFVVHDLAYGAAIECGLAFFGSDRLLFGTDMPFDPERGPGYVRAGIEAIRGLELSAAEREKILWRNAERLLELGHS